MLVSVQSAFMYQTVIKRKNLTFFLNGFCLNSHNKNFLDRLIEIK